MVTLIMHKSCPSEMWRGGKFYIQQLQKYDGFSFLIAFRLLLYLLLFKLTEILQG